MAVVAEPIPVTVVSIKHLGGKKKKFLATNVNLKLMSQRAFSQGKELLHVFSFPNQLRARECETALKSIPSEGKGQRGKNVFNALMFLTCGLPNSPTPQYSTSVPSLRTKTHCLTLAETLFTCFWTI